MKNCLKKILYVSIAVPALMAGTFACGGAGRLPRGTLIQGVNVGGLLPAQAVQVVREAIRADLKPRSLNISAPCGDYCFRYPEISFRDDLNSVVGGIKRTGEYGCAVHYYLNGFNDVVSGICDAQFRQAQPPYAQFNGGEGEAFEYFEGAAGAVADEGALRRDILASLSSRTFGGEFAPVAVNVKKVHAEISMEQVRENTARLSVFTTYFDCENSPRVSNIRLAGDKISGTVLEPGESFSFNGTVGPRTVKNGFKNAKVIENGRFVCGIGGGVCQVSTTLYNAALLAGLRVTEYHPHSLAVSYVKPSRDAMVSGEYCDLKFCNTTDCPVYIRVLTGLYYTRCEIYGKSDGVEYSLESVLLGEENGGVQSECYMLASSDRGTSRTLLRRDRYKPAAAEVPPEQ